MNRLRMRWSLWVVLVFWCGAASVFGQEEVKVKESATVSAAPTAVEAVTPADAVLLVQVKNLSGIEDGFSKTAVSDALSQVELLSTGKEVLKEAARFLVVYLTDTPYDQVRRMVDKGFAIVLLPSKDQFEKPPFALVLDVSGDRAGFEQMLNEKLIPRLKLFAEGGSVETVDMQGVKVQKFTQANNDATYLALLGNAFVAGPEAAVKSMVAASQGQSPNVGSVAAFQAVRQATAVDAGASVYVNLASVFAMKEQDWQENSPLKKNLDALGLTGIQGIGVSAAFEGKGVRERIFIATGKERTGLLKHFADQAPKAPTSLALVPPGFSLYMTIQSGGGTKLYEDLKGLAQEVWGDEGLMRIQAVEAAFQQNAQLDIEQDLFGPLGSEGFVAVDIRKLVETAVTRKPGFTDVSFIAGMEVEDSAKMEGSLAQLFLSPFFANNGVTVNKERYKDVDLNVVTNVRNPAICPAYAFVDKFVIFSSSADTLKQVVDGREAKKSLATSEDFAQLQAMLPKESNFMAYFDTKSVLPAVMGMLSQKAPKGLRPFLPSIKVLSDRMPGMGVVVASTPDGIRGDAYSPVGGPFWVVTFASLGKLSSPKGAGKVARVTAEMGRLEAAIQRFHEQSGRYPTTLAELVPLYIKKVPVDPFSPDHSEIGYVLLAGTATAAPGAAPAPGAPPATGAPKPEAPAAGQQTPTEFAFLLISVGPDGKKDIDPQDPNVVQLLGKVNSTNPDDIAALKAKVYQFRKEIYPDKRALNDAGDIVRPGK